MMVTSIGHLMLGIKQHGIQDRKGFSRYRLAGVSGDNTITTDPFNKVKGRKIY